MSVNAKIVGPRAFFKRFSIAIAIAIGIVVAMPAATVPAQAEVRVDISFHYANDGTQNKYGTFACEPKFDVEGIAVEVVSEDGLEPGDTWVGTEHNKVCLYPQPDNTIKYRGSLVMDPLTITGCGTGTLAYEYKGTLSAPDPVTGNRTDNGAGDIISGSGTGDLEDIKGQISWTGTASPNFTGVGYGTGAVKC
ncbi:hypothetical protein IU459_36405 [Nocardia amamiensis]|uniref:Uncharacterized protein n=1 Tax=Nocardia amamiensis TaxID=404578 RepID=A0ABS0D286_9NOCA|nr:hypothetical protein [Nocardia amamiensis]MBF6302955.1 hypothetical protein [Nocardia amamiensis]